MGVPLVDFVLDFDRSGLPAPVLRHAALCVADLIGVAAAGASTPLAAIIGDHAVDHFGAGRLQSRLLFDGRVVSPAGAALAGGMMIDSFDAHDGHVLTKGHAGAAILPGLVAVADTLDRTVGGLELLERVVVAYEVAHRAGMATHRTARDYHTSGSWNALGVVAGVAAWLKLDRDRLRHGLGIAEYHGPRSQMMRVIDHPTMLKDGSGWGAMVGVSAAYLAESGFTGAPALVAEGEDVRDLWHDIGTRWTITEMYFKPYPVCRWAQPSIRCALTLREQHQIDPARIKAVEVHTFHEATRILHRAPANTEEAQYSLPFPVAAALVRGKVEPADISGPSLKDTTILAMAQRIRLIEDPEINATFPKQRLARVAILMQDGTRHESAIMPAHGDPERPLGDAGLRDKFQANAATTLRRERAEALWQASVGLEQAESIQPLLDLVMAPARQAKSSTARKRA